MSSYVSKNSDKLAPLALIGALGVVGYLAYDYLSNQSGSYIGGSSGGGYYTPEGSPLMAAGGYSPLTDSAPALSYTPLNYGTTNSGANAQFTNAQFTNAQFTDSKKEQSKSNSDSLLKAAVSGATYTELTGADIAAYNASLLKSIQAEDRTGGGSVSSALAFMGIGEGARYVATIPNTAGISNAGANLTSVVYDSGAYEVRDWRGNIVSSGSAGAFQALSTATKKEEKTSGTAGAVTSSSYDGKKNTSGGGGSSLSTVNIVSDKKSAVRSSSSSSSGGGSSTSYYGGTVSSSSITNWHH